MVHGNIRIFKAFGIPVELNISWFIIFALVSWSLVSGYFPTAYPNLSVGTYWGMGLIAALLLFVSVLLHELGHSYVAKTHGVPIRRITLFLFGGVSQLSKESADPRTEYMIAIAGPGVSFALMGIFLVLYRIISDAYTAGPVAPVLKYLAYVNGILGAFNLIPGFPLDGGRLLRAFIWTVTGDLQRSTFIASRVGSAIGLGFVALGFISVFTGRFIFGLWMVLIGFFLRQAAQASYLQVVVTNALKGVKVGDIMKSDVVTVPEDISVQDLIDNYFFRYHYDCFPVTAGGHLRGLVTLENIRHVPRNRWTQVLVSEVMLKDMDRLKVKPQDDAAEVLRRVVKERCGKMPVVDGETVVGIITRKDIMEALRIFSDLGH